MLISMQRLFESVYKTFKTLGIRIQAQQHITETNTHRQTMIMMMVMMKKKKQKREREREKKARTCKYVCVHKTDFIFRCTEKIPNCREHAVCVHSWVLRCVCACMYI